MAENPLVVFALSETLIPLAPIRDVLLTEGFPVSFGTEAAGEADEEQLSVPDWEIAFLRWLEPELHEVALVEALRVGVEEEAMAIVGQHLLDIADFPDPAGRLIIADHLNRTRVVYAVEILPALLAVDEHDAWAALDVLLRFVAQSSEGLIYAAAEGYCDSEGELILAESEADGDEIGVADAEDAD